MARGHLDRIVLRRRLSGEGTIGRRGLQSAARNRTVPPAAHLSPELHASAGAACPYARGTEAILASPSTRRDRDLEMEIELVKYFDPAAAAKIEADGEKAAQAAN